METVNQHSNPTPKLLAEQARAAYLARHNDPMAGPAAGRWRVHDNDGTWDLESTLPIQLSFSADSRISWDEVGAIEPQSEALWKYSLGYLPTLLLASEDARVVNRVMTSFHQYTQTPEWLARSDWMTSTDHCAATRLRSLCSLSVMYQERNWEYPIAALALIQQDVTRTLADQDHFIKTNNHGAMMAIALLHTACLFEGMPGGLHKLGLERLEKILDEIFDEHGIPAENSPEYHAFWLRLIVPIHEFLEIFSLHSGAAQSINERLDRSMKALEHFVDHQGKYIPIGDSHAGSATVPTARNSTLVSEESGFATYSNNDTLLTFNCGHRKYAHKHCDDTSITLAYRGVALVLDSGFYGHDWKDDRVVHTKSQSAHSGLFFEEFDDTHPGQIYSPGKEKIVGSLRRIASEEFTVEGTVKAREGMKLTRLVTVETDRKIVLTDKVDGDPSTAALQRFILPSQMRIEIGTTTISGKIGGIALEIEFNPDSLTAPLRLYSGYTGTPMRGWVSPRLGQITPAFCLEIPIKLATQHILTIQLMDE